VLLQLDIFDGYGEVPGLEGHRVEEPDGGGVRKGMAERNQHDRAHSLAVPEQIEGMLARKLEALLEGGGVYHVGETWESIVALVRDELDRWRSARPGHVVALEFLDTQVLDGRAYAFHERDGRWSLLVRPFDNRQKTIGAIERALRQLGSSWVGKVCWADPRSQRTRWVGSPSSTTSVSRISSAGSLSTAAVAGIEGRGAARVAGPRR